MKALKLKLTTAKLKRDLERAKHNALMCLVSKPPAKTCTQAEIFLNEHGAKPLDDGLDGQRCFFLRVIADRDEAVAYRSRKAWLAANAELANSEVYAIYREMNALAASDLE